MLLTFSRSFFSLSMKLTEETSAEIIDWKKLPVNDIQICEHKRNLILDCYKHYKYYHFYSICFGMGCGAALYRPFRSLMLPAVPALFFTVLFEVVGICFDLPAHTATCKGPPYDRRDFYWGFCFALFVAILNLNSYHVYTLSYGCGVIVFALRGAERKCSSLRKLRKRQRPRW